MRAAPGALPPSAQGTAGGSSGSSSIKKGTVNSGFSEDFRTQEYRSAPFEATKLKRLVINVQTLRGLSKKFDGPSSGGKQWPLLVGNDRQRKGTFTFKIVLAEGPRAGKSVYEASMYWHRREDEEDEGRQEEEQVREEITKGNFGLDVSFGKDVTVQYDEAALRTIAKRLDVLNRLGFEHVWTVSYHAREGEAAAVDADVMRGAQNALEKARREKKSYGYDNGRDDDDD